MKDHRHIHRHLRALLKQRRSFLHLVLSTLFGAAVLTSLFVGIRRYSTQPKDTNDIQVKSSSDVLSSAAAVAEPMSVTDLKAWVASVVEAAQKAQPIPQVTQVTNAIYYPVPTAAVTQQVAQTSTPAPIINNFYSRSVVESPSIPTPTASVSSNLSIGANGHLDGTLSVGGLLTLTGGLDLSGGILSVGGLAFTLPDTSDILVGLSSTGTLLNKTIDGTTNTISNLIPANFSADTLSQWTNDVGFIAADTADTLTNKIIDATTNTLSDLSVDNFTTNALSQWSNDIGFITSDSVGALTNKTITTADNIITGLSAGNFSTDTLSQWTNDVGFITADTVADLTGKTINAGNNILSGLSSSNFTTAALSQWTNDVGYTTLTSVGALTNKTISGAVNTIADIPNSATTASASNLAGSIIARDMSGNFSAGAITASLIGNASSATTAATSLLATTAGTVTNGLYTTGSYANPSWLTSIDGSKLVGTVLANALSSGTYGINISGSAATAVLATKATLADTVTDGIYTTGAYADPSWLTSIDGSKLIGTITATALSAGIYPISITGTAATALIADEATIADAVTDGLYSTGSYADPAWLTSIDGSKLLGAITATALTPGTYVIDITGSASHADIASLADTVTDGLYETGSYSNPAWLTSLDGEKLTGLITANALTAGTYAVDVSGTAAHSLVSDSASLADAVVDGLYSTGSYANPSWLTSISGSKLIGTVTANAIAGGTYAIDVSGNAATASLATVASLANAVTNGLYSTGSYGNPSWLTSIDGSKLIGTITANALSAGTYAVNVSGNAATSTLASSVTNGLYSTGSYANPSWITGLDGSKLTGTITATALAAGTYVANISGNAATATNASTVTNGVYTTGSYSNPAWITGLAGSKLSGTVTASALAAGSYAIDVTGNAATVTNGLYSTATYANPAWLTSVDGGKLTGVITATALAAGTYAANISGNAATSTLASTVTNGVYTTSTYSNPSWITGLDGSKLSGTITANALTAGDYTVNNLTTSNSVITSGTLANTLLSGSCVVNLNALGLAAFQSSATISAGQIFYNSSKNRHSRITSVSTCTDSGGNPWRIISLTDSITGSAAGDSYTIYAPTGSIGNTSSGFFNNFYAITLKGLVSTLTGGFDVAEEYPSNDETLSPGEVVSLNPAAAGSIQRSSSAYDINALGIISTNPGLTLGDETIGTWKKVALAGRVPVKVSTENGDIAVGDQLTTSSIPGVAMKATHAGVVIGKALESFAGSGSQTGIITAFVMLGSYIDASPSLAELADNADTGALTLETKAVFKAGLETDTIASIGDTLRLLSDTVFVGRPYFGTDTAGFAIIEQGASEVHLIYERPYTEVPIVNASITLAQSDQLQPEDIFTDNIRFVIKDTSADGFTIVLNKPAPSDIHFSWTAFAVQHAQTVVSEHVFSQEQTIVPEEDEGNPVQENIEILPDSTHEDTATSSSTPSDDPAPENQ